MHDQQQLAECGNYDSLFERCFDREGRSPNRRFTDKYGKEYAALLGTLIEGLFEWSCDTDIVVSSPRLLDILGIGGGVHHMEGFLTRHVLPEDLPLCRRAISELKNDPCENDFTLQMRVTTPLGAVKTLRVQGKALRGEDGALLRAIGSVLDLEENQTAYEDYPIVCDELTGMATKHMLSRRLREDIRAGRINSAAVIVLDLDNLKAINDTLDHYIGDKVITQIADVLLQRTGKNGLAVRLSNDEFAIYLPGSGTDEAVEFSHRLQDAIKAPMQIGKLTLCVTASLGISMYPDHAQTDKALLRYADVAMQHAKTKGKDTVTVFHHSMFERILRHETVGRAIRYGLEKGEFQVYYQPQYDPQTGTIVGFEALLRLNSSLVGNVSPSEFIPAAEESGHIHELGRWVFGEACKTAAEFRARGYVFGKMAINLSLVQLQRQSFADDINRVLRKLELSPDCIELEVTETQLVDYMGGGSMDVVKNMEALGLDLALDDFGSGYSSLNQLRQLWISTLKIDKKFIDHITTDPKDYEIVKLVVNLAHCLQLCVVAEGVETASQLELVRQMGCDKVQGFYYSRAVPKEEAEALLRRQKTG
ncbi:MAG: putative bifunctional diguanylate cyclase/phosphodiesterase [Acetanaerobacterium sp.]